MIRINLLPVREWRRKEAVRQQFSIFLLSLVLLVTILGGVGMTIQSKIRAQREEIATLQARKAKLAFVNQKIAEADKKRQKIEEKFKAIEGLQQGRTLTVMAFDEVITALPLDRVWITQLNFNNDTHMHLTGVALDNHTVALFMKRLGASPLVQSVTLANTRRNAIQGHELMEFDLQLGIAMPKEPGEQGEKAAPPETGKGKTT